MALPAGVITVYVHFGSFMDDAGVVYGGTVTFQGSTNKVWAATGEPIIPRPIVVTLDGDGQGALYLPATDQSGFVDGDGNEVTDWTYTVTVSLKGVSPYTRVITLPAAGVTGLSVDLDLMIDVEASPGTVVALPTVLSVNGQTGAVVIDPGTVELSADAGNLAVFGTDGKVYVGPDPAKANAGDLAAVALSGSWTDLTDAPTVPTQYSDLSGFVPTSALPPLAINDVFAPADEPAMLALVAQRGDMAIRTDTGQTFVLATDDPTVPGNWKQVSAAGSVVSVNGQTGTVVLGISDISGLQSHVDTVNSQAVLGRWWEGTGGTGTWTARPAVSKPVPAFSTNDALAPPPPLPSNGDVWWRHKDATPGPVTP